MTVRVFTISGRVIDRLSRRGLAGVRVEAWDKDLLINDMVGSCFTDRFGRFRMIFDSRAFREFFFDQLPDVFFRVYYRDRMVLETQQTLVWRINEQLKQVTLEVEPPPADEADPGWPDPGQGTQPGEDEGEIPGETYHPPQGGVWREGISEWWRQRQIDHPHHTPSVEMPRSRLDCTSHFGPQIVALATGEPGTVHFTVWNEGNFPAWTCYVQLWEGPGGYSHPLRDYALRGQALITLQAGEQREVDLPWLRMRQSGRIVGIVFDPLLDPIDFTLVEQYNRHITSVHYTNLE
jgi:hypothetical protein